jgi:predicted nucleic acid-binding protein
LATHRLVGGDPANDPGTVIHLDANVLIDARDPSSWFHTWAKETIARHVAGDGAGVDAIALAEILGHVTDRAVVVAQLQGWGVELLSVPPAAAGPAASAFASYLARLKLAGITRDKRTPLPDFLIGAHAQVTGRRLATRDVDRFRTYFPAVELICPAW